WRGDGGQVSEFATRLAGSSDLYEHTGRRPSASINFVTCHDGFTLHDLVSYEHKHNEANGEGNRDGESHNHSMNLGVEGPTDDPKIKAARAQQRRNFMATLLLSQGVPMISGGDELGRTQRGNNNAYCQDNDLSWYNWEEGVDEKLLHFCQRLIQYRSVHPVFHRRRWFQGRKIYGSDVKDIAWFNLEGQPMQQEDWDLAYIKTLGIFLNGETIPNPNPKGEPRTDDSFYIILN